MPKDSLTKYRPMSFWALNGELEEKELARQMEEFAAAGLGGFFMHARGDLKTPYLSRHFMEKIKFCVEKAKELGLEAWLYDEKDWPSGQAGGAVYRYGARNRALHLVCREPDSDIPLAKEVARTKTKDGVIAFCAEYGVGANGLSEQTTQEFIELTHEYYKSELGEEFGGVVPGVFFDEPQYASYYDVSNYVPWCEDFPERYREIWGEDIEPELISLFKDQGDYKKVRKQYWYTVSELYARRFALPIYEWCEENGLISTGHFECEEDFNSQIRTTGGVMRQYEYIHYPGTDSLGLGIYAPWIYLQASSVGAQLGRERVMCECFGVGGQNMSLHERRWIYGMLLSLGTNFFIPHIAWYSLRGNNKRDCPPHNQYHQPWWRYSETLETSVSKAAEAMAGASPKGGVLMLNPMTTAWCEYRPGFTERVELLQKKYEAMFYTLYDNGIFFHYGDEMLLERHASVEKGKMRVGEIVYDTVILPCCNELLDSTKQLLAEFEKAGGTIYSVNDPDFGPPGMGEIVDAHEIVQKLKDENPCPFASDARFWHYPLEKDGKDIYIISNPERDTPVSIHYNGEDGAVTICAPDETFCLQRGDAFTIPAGGFCIVRPGERAPERKSFAHIKTVVPSGPWEVSASAHLSEHANVANLDFCQLRFEGGQWSEPVYTRRAYLMINERAAAAGAEAKKAGQNWLAQQNVRFFLRFRFHNQMEEKLSGGMKLCVENADGFEIAVNGVRLEKNSLGKFLDPSIDMFAISERLKPGENEIILSGITAADYIVEDIYLLGNFGVFLSETGERILQDLPKSIETTNGLERKGFSFLAGKLGLSTEIFVDSDFDRAEIALDNPCGTVFEAIINGESAGFTFASPWSMDITSLLKKGSNSLTIQVVNTLKNLLGPLHNARYSPKGEGPRDYMNPEFFSDMPLPVKTGFECCEIRLYAEKNP